MKNIAYSYIRFSTPEQAQGDSLRRQLDACRAYCAKHNLQLDDSLRDKGVSAFRGKHASKGKLGGFLQAIEDGRVKPGSTLIVESLDRLSRQDVMTALQQFLGIVNAGIAIVTLFDSKTYTKQTINAQWTDLVVSISIMARANEESETKSARAKEACEKKRQEALASKKPATGKSPGWIDFQDGKFTINKDKKPTVLRMVKLAMDGHGVVGITRRFNQAGVQNITKHKKVKAWTSSTVKHILRSRTLVGEVCFCDGTVVPGYYPSVLTAVQFDRLQDILDSRKINIKGRPSKRVRNLFGGLAKSGHDGGSLALVEKRKGNVTFISRKSIDGEVGERSFPYPDFERSILYWIRGLELGSRTAPDSDEESIEVQLRSVRKRAQEVQEALSSPAGGSSIRLASVLVELEKQEADLERGLQLSRQDKVKPSLTNTHGELIKLIDQIEGGDEDLRMKVRMQLQQLIKRMTLWIYGDCNQRCGIVKVELHDSTKYLAIRIRRKHPTVSLHWKTVKDFDPEKLAQKTADVVDRTEFAPAKDCKRIL